jgi:hypothetical protein
MRLIRGHGHAPSAAIKSAIWGLGFPYTMKKTSGETFVGFQWAIAARNAEHLAALSTGRSVMDPPINSLVKREKTDCTVFPNLAVRPEGAKQRSE